jgi:hypothetical protein
MRLMLPRGVWLMKNTPPRRLATVAAILTAAVSTAGCRPASFEERFEEIQVGQSREDVSRQLGKPDGSGIGSAPPVGFGPRQGLRVLLGESGTFEEWRFKRDDITYYVWFASTEGLPMAEWRVVDKSAIPEGAVF